MDRIRFGAKVDAARVSAHTREVLTRLLDASGNGECLITSAARTPTEQARIMFDNLERHGVTAQRRLYKAPGQKVIDTYALLMGHASAKGIIKAMASTIVEVGPAKVSRHCADPARLNVVDVAPSSLTHPDAFRAAAEADADVSKVLGPPTDPAFHFEIPQPGAT